MSEFWTILGYVGLIVGIPASIVTLIPPWRKQVWSRLRDWFYKRSNRYLVDHLREEVTGLKEQLAENRMETSQAIHDMLLLHSRTTTDLSDVVTARELLSRLQFLKVQNRGHQPIIDDLVVLAARYWRPTTDRSPQRQRIIEAAKGRDVPPLPKLPGS